MDYEQKGKEFREKYEDDPAFPEMLFWCSDEVLGEMADELEKQLQDELNQFKKDAKKENRNKD